MKFLQLRFPALLLALVCPALLALTACRAAPAAAPTPQTVAATPAPEPATPEQAAPEPAETPAPPAPAETPAPAQIVLQTTEGILTTGHSWTLRAQVLPGDGGEEPLRWTSDNEAVATVSESGVVTGHSAGTAVLTAHCGDATARYTLYVKDPVCAVCGGAGHTQANCPVQAAAAQQAAQQQAAQQAAQQQAAEQAAQQAAEQQAAQQQAESDPLVTNIWGITLRQSEWDAIYQETGARPEDCTGYSSGIDWTQDSSCADGDMIVQGEDGYGHMILDEQGRPVQP